VEFSGDVDVVKVCSPKGHRRTAGHIKAGRPGKKTPSHPGGGNFRDSRENNPESASATLSVVAGFRHTPIEVMAFPLDASPGACVDLGRLLACKVQKPFGVYEQEPDHVVLGAEAMIRIAGERRPQRVTFVSPCNPRGWAFCGARNMSGPVSLTPSGPLWQTKETRNASSIVLARPEKTTPLSVYSTAPRSAMPERC